MYWSFLPPYGAYLQAHHKYKIGNVHLSTSLVMSMKKVNITKFILRKFIYVAVTTHISQYSVQLVITSEYNDRKYTVHINEKYMCGTKLTLSHLFEGKLIPSSEWG